MDGIECDGMQCKEIPNQENKDEEKLSNALQWCCSAQSEQRNNPALSATSVSHGALYLTLHNSQSLQEMSSTLLTHFPH